MLRTLLSLICVTFFTAANSQVIFQKQWDRTFGGTDVENLKAVIQTSDGGFLLGGITKSAQGADVSEPARGSQDYWIVKTDSSGNKMWDKRFGGSLDEQLYSVFQTTDGGYILGGATTSDSGGDISEPTRGSMDYWIVKTDSMGNKLWDKRFGGSNFDQLSVVYQIDAGYILGGISMSDSSGDVTQNSYGSEDFWIVVTDHSGNKLWDHRYGGDMTDELFSLEPTSDGGYILGGRSLSNISNDVTDTLRGLHDYWIIKIDQSGTKEWDKRYGGSNRDMFRHVEQLADKGYILGGYTWSENDGDITEPTRDTSASLTVNRGDIWIVRTDSLGQKIWDKRYGSVWVEADFGYVNETTDGGFLWGCASYSDAGGEKSENNFGREQAWVVKTDSAGNLLWDKTLFVDGEDEAGFTIELPNGCYLVASYSYGDSIAYKTENSRGVYDFWMYKMCETTTPQLPVANFTALQPVLCEGACFSFINQSYDASTFVWSFPGGSPDSSTVGFPEICYTDTGIYPVTLIAINSSGSDTITITNAVTVLPAPAVSIMVNGDTLSVSPGFMIYEWYLDGNPLANDTNYFMVALLNGDYSVKATDSAGCAATDTVFTFIVGIKEFMTNGQKISLYPNPANAEINIMGLESMMNGTLKIFDIAGREVYFEKVNSVSTAINIESFNSGIYFVEIITNDKRINARFIKE